MLKDYDQKVRLFGTRIHLFCMKFADNSIINRFNFDRTVLSLCTVPATLASDIADGFMIARMMLQWGMIVSPQLYNGAKLA